MTYTNFATDIGQLTTHVGIHNKKPPSESVIVFHILYIKRGIIQWNGIVRIEGNVAVGVA